MTSMAAAGAAGTAAAVGGAAGLFTFGYNRANYMYDAGMRYARFTGGREMGIKQSEMYRSDIRQLTELTGKKVANYAVMGAVCCALCIALYCAGRLGLHGPSPPAWIINLWYTNNAAAFAFQLVNIWLCFHTLYRSQAAQVHLLTRKTRLPVPTLKQLDSARKFASEFEQQGWSDIFRVPYACNNGAPKTDRQRGDPQSSGEEEPAQGGSRRRGNSAPPAGNRKEKMFKGAPSTWVREEFAVDRAGLVAGPAPASASPDQCPEHFQLYMKVMKDWYQYDIYARICLMYGWTSFFHAAAFYGLGHINIELRAFWVPYACGAMIMTLHALIMRFDIVHQNESTRPDRLPNCQYLAPVSWLFAAIGMSLDFQVRFSMTGVAFTWIIIFICYICELLFWCRLLEVVIPDDYRYRVKLEEQIGCKWWPQEWSVPSSFTHVLHLVAPPTKLQPGQFDIVREIKNGVGVSGPEHHNETMNGGRVDLYGLLRYAEQLFEWAFSDPVFNKLPKPQQDQLRRNYDDFEKEKAKAEKQQSQGQAESAARVVGGMISNIQSLSAFSDVFPHGAGSGSDSGSGGSSGDEAAKRAAAVPSGRHRTPPFDATRHVEPWRLVSSIVAMGCCAWVFLILGCLVDVIVGEQGLITAPHWSRPPMTRLSKPEHELGTPYGFPWPAGDRAYIPEQMAWHEEKRHPHMYTIADPDAHGLGREGEKSHWSDRRLGSRREEFMAAGGSRGFKTALNALLAVLPNAKPAQTAVPESISWPGFFEPQLLACGPHSADGAGSVAALTSRGFGASAGLFGQSGNRKAETFSLTGISHLTPLVGAHWGPGVSDGLTLISSRGDLMTCPGARPAHGGAWYCSQMVDVPSLKPLTQGNHLSAAAAAIMDSRMYVALVDENSPDFVSIFVHDGQGESSSWLPLGEMPVPTGGGRVSLAFAGGRDLIMATDTGAVVRRRLHDGAMVASIPHREGSQPQTSWRASCGFHHHQQHGGVAHLHLQKAAAARRPAIFTVSAIESSSELYQ